MEDIQSINHGAKSTYGNRSSRRITLTANRSGGAEVFFTKSGTARIVDMEAEHVSVWCSYHVNIEVMLYAYDNFSRA